VHGINAWRRRVDGGHDVAVSEVHGHHHSALAHDSVVGCYCTVLQPESNVMVDVNGRAAVMVDRVALCFAGCVL
jgi:hypothetical protein